jgi:hypothetical protein
MLDYMKTLRISLALLVLVLGACALLVAENPAVDPHSVPVVHAGIGSCSVQFTARDGSGSPLYDAKIKVHISYGFLGVHKMDLEVGTNIDGKARFDGLPNKTKQALEFKASKGEKEGIAFFDPVKNCKTEHSIVLMKPDSSSQP